MFDVSCLAVIIGLFICYGGWCVWVFAISYCLVLYLCLLLISLCGVVLFVVGLIVSSCLDCCFVGALLVCYCFRGVLLMFLVVILYCSLVIVPT